MRYKLTAEFEIDSSEKRVAFISGITLCLKNYIKNVVCKYGNGFATMCSCTITAEKPSEKAGAFEDLLSAIVLLHKIDSKNPKYKQAFTEIFDLGQNYSKRGINPDFKVNFFKKMLENKYGITI